MGGIIDTEKNEEYLDKKDCTASDWRKWIKYNLRDSKKKEKDIYSLMKCLLEKMSQKNKPKIFKATFQNTKFLNKIFEETNDIAALAYLYQEASSCFPEEISENFLTMFKQILENKDLEQETLAKTFFYNDMNFKNLEKITEKTIVFLCEKIKVVLDALEPIKYEDFPRRDVSKVNFWIFWLAIYENSKDPKQEISHKKLLIDMTINDLSTKNHGLKKNSLFQLFNEVVFPLIASHKTHLARNLIYFICSVDQKIFKDYLKKSDRYFPSGHTQGLNMVRNLLEEGFSFGILKYVKKLIQYYQKEKELECLRVIGEKYLYKRLIGCLTSEMFFYNTYKLMEILLINASLLSNAQKLQYKDKLKRVKEYMERFFKHKDQINKIDDLIDKFQEDKLSLGKKLSTGPPPIVYSSYSSQVLYEDMYINTNQISKFYNTTNAKVPYRGLINGYQVCYMNSFLQCLFMTSELRKKLLRSNKNNQPPVVKEMINLFTNLKSEDFSFGSYKDNSVDPSFFKKLLRDPYKTSSEQQDVYLFGGNLFEQISEYYNSETYKKEESIMKNLFSCQFKNKVRCLDCGTTSSSHDEIQWMIMINLNLTSKRDFISLIRESLKPTVIENSIKCDKCKTKSKKTETITSIKRLPPYLIIALNLTNFDQQREEPVKILEKVKPPTKMVINNVFKEVFSEEKNNQYMEENYELYAIVVHKGITSDNGHYYAIARNLDKSEISYDDCWYVFNDRDVVKIGANLNLEEFLKKYETPYLFFFESKNKQAIVSDVEKTIRF